MKNFYKKSLAFNLAVKFSVLVAFVVLSFSAAIVFILNVNVRTRQSDELKNAARTVSERFEAFANRKDRRPSEWFEPPQPVPPVQWISEKIPYYISFSVFASKNAGVSGQAGFYSSVEKVPLAADFPKTDFFSEENLLLTNDPFMPQLALTAPKVRHYFEKDFYIDGPLDILYFSQEITLANGSSVIVQTAFSMEQDFGQHSLSGIIAILAVSFVPIVLISFAVVYFITSRTMNPVVKITEMARRINSTNLLETLPQSGSGNEIDILAQTFNEVFARLKSDFDREKQFTSDVSHELKTPMAVILGYANLIRRWGKSDPVQLDSSINRLIAEVHTMEAVVQNLLQLSRLDCGRIQLNVKKIDVMQLFSRLKADTMSWAPECTFTIENSDVGFELFADSELLYQALTIIVSNSVKFFNSSRTCKNHAIQEIQASQDSDATSAPEKLEISISARVSEDSKFQLWICDNGPGIPEKVLPHVFERFFRGDEAHTRSAGGSGLGLSIVMSIMKALGGTAFATSDGKSGTSIILEFPPSN